MTTPRKFLLSDAVVAGVLALSRWPGWSLIVMVPLNLVLAAMLRQRFRGLRRVAARGFGMVATVANIGCAVLCISHLNLYGGVLMFAVWFLTFPFILGLGAAWATEATRCEAVPRRSPRLAWPMVLVLAFLPLTMLVTAWPLRLAFLASRPALDRLADRVAGGQAPGLPIWAGVFRVVGSVVDPVTGNVGLIIDPAPSGRSGFVRLARGGRRGGPFYNLNFDLFLGDRWWYECED
jgi:hypothetical protein